MSTISENRSELTSFLSQNVQNKRISVLSDSIAFIDAVPNFYSAHVLCSPLDQSKIIDHMQYSIFQLHGNKIKFNIPLDSLDSLETFCRGMLKNGRSEVVVISDASNFHAFLVLALLNKQGMLVLFGEARELAHRLTAFFQDSDACDNFIVLRHFEGQTTAKETLKALLCDLQSDIHRFSAQPNVDTILLTPCPGCSSFKEDFSLNYAEMDARVKSKIYLKRRFASADLQSPVRSSPYVEKMDNTNFEFPKLPHSSLAPFDVLTNVLGIKSDVRYHAISGLHIRGCVQAVTSRLDLIYLEDISECQTMISRLNQSGDLLIRLRSPWLIAFAEACWVMRLALAFKSVSLVRSALDPEHSFVFAENFFKHRRMPHLPVIEQVALFPKYTEFVRGFNFRVFIDAKRTLHARPALNPLKLLDDRRRIFNFYAFFGSFDPVHENHAALVTSLAAEPESQIAVIPNRGVNENKREISDLMHRHAMLELRFKDLPNVTVSQTSETTEAWSKKERIAKELGERLFADRDDAFHLHLVLGEDSFKKATGWKKSGLTKMSCKFRVYPRSEEDLQVPRELNDRITVVEDHKDKFPGLSSSKLRRFLAEGKPFQGLWIDSRVLDYVRQHGLYKRTEEAEEALFPDSDNEEGD